MGKSPLSIRALALAIVALLLAAATAVLISLSPPGGRNARIPAAGSGPAERAREYLDRIEREPRDRQAHYQLGLLHEENGHFMAALDSFRVARSRHEQVPGLVAAMGRCLNRLQRWNEALPLLEEACHADPQDSRAMVDLATALIGLGRPDVARMRLREMSNRSHLFDAGSGSASDIAALAAAFDALQDAENALRWSKAAIRVAPSVPAAYLIAGRVLLSRGESAEGSRLLVKAVELMPESAAARELLGDALAGIDAGQVGALERWLEAIELKSKRPKTYYQAANVLAKQGERVRAAEVLTRAGLNTADKAYAFSQAASAWQRAGDPDQARYCRATAAAAAGKLSVALAHYEDLARSPVREWKKRGLDGTAEMYRLMKRPEEFLAAAKEAAFTGTPADDLRIANAYLLTGSASGREEYLLRAVKKDPDLQGIVYCELASLAEERGRKVRAARFFERSVESDPGSVTALLGLSRLQIDGAGKKASPAEAVEFAARAAAAAPGDWRAFRQLGIACSRAGSAVRAKQAFQHAIDLNPRNPECYRLLAAQLLQLGEEKAAREAESLAKRFSHRREP